MHGCLWLATAEVLVAFVKRLALGHHVDKVVERVADGVLSYGPVVAVLRIDGLSKVRLGERDRHEDAAVFEERRDLTTNGTTHNI